MTNVVDQPVEATEAADEAAAKARKEAIARVVGGLLFPFLMVTMMVSGYLGAMHSPTPHDLPVAVVGTNQADSERLAAALEESNPSAVEVRVAADADEARSLVVDREVVGAVVFTDGTGADAATVYTAGAAGASQASTVNQLLQPFAAAEAGGASVEDLVPAPAHDSAGLAVMFMTTALILAGYMPLSLLLSAAPELLRFRRVVPLLAAWSALAAGVVWLVAGPILGAIEGHTAAVLGICWLAVFAVSAVQLFLTRIVGPLAVLVGMLFLMVLGIPASNLGMSVHTMPGFFETLYKFLPTPAAGEALRSLLYFDGDGVGGHLVVLAIGLAVGLALTALVDVLKRRRNPDAGDPEPNIVSFVGDKPQSTRARYVSLLLFPFTMVVMMLSIMTSAMYQPAPRELPVAIAAAETVQAEQMIAGLEEKMPGMFDFRVATSEQEARDLVADRTVVGSYVLPSAADPSATLYTAGAAGMSQQQAVTAVFTQIAGQQGVPVVNEDITPLVKADSMGTVSLYLSIGWIMSGFLVIIVLRTAAPAVMALRKLLPILIGWSVVMSAWVWTIADVFVGAIDGHFWPLVGVGALAIFSAALFTTVFARIMGMLAVIPVVAIMMFLGVPASGGGLSIYMSPEIFRVLHEILPLPAAVESARSILYFGGDGVGSHLLTFTIWGVVSLLVVIALEWFSGRKSVEPVVEEKVAELV